MESQKQVTMVRLYLPEECHATRKAQMQRVIHILRDELRAGGITVLPGVAELEDGHKLRYETIGDVLRKNPDPPAIIEFFCESAVADPIDAMLHEIIPGGYSVRWQAALERLKVPA